MSFSFMRNNPTWAWASRIGALLSEQNGVFPGRFLHGPSPRLYRDYWSGGGGINGPSSIPRGGLCIDAWKCSKDVSLLVGVARKWASCLTWSRVTHGSWSYQGITTRMLKEGVPQVDVSVPNPRMHKLPHGMQ